MLRTARAVSLPQGSVLFRQGQPGDGCFWVVHGLLKGSIGSDDGEDPVVSIYGPGDLIGAPTLIDGLPRSTTAEAISDCELTMMDRTTFQSSLNRHPELYRWLTAALVHRVREAFSDMAGKSFKVQGHVARTLFKVAALTGEDLDADQVGMCSILPYDVLASIAGMSRESNSRTGSLA